MLAEKNKNIKKAYGLLKVISKDEKARMLYESKYAEISDKRTRIKEGKEEVALCTRKDGNKIICLAYYND